MRGDVNFQIIDLAKVISLHSSMASSHSKLNHSLKYSHGVLFILRLRTHSSSNILAFTNKVSMNRLTTQCIWEETCYALMCIVHTCGASQPGCGHKDGMIKGTLLISFDRYIHVDMFKETKVM